MSFKNKYARAVTLDLSNRSQITTDQIVDKKLTVIDYSIANTVNGECAIVLFSEMPDNFYFAGKVLTGIIKEIDADEFDKRELRKNGMQIKLYTTENKDHSRTYTGVEILN